MIRLDKFIEKINSEDRNLEERVFSIFDHSLTRKEAEHEIMSYQQAVDKNRINLFNQYERIYLNSFREFYNFYGTDIILYTIYSDNSQIPKNINLKKVKIDEDGVEIFYECANVNDFLSRISENSKENYPFKNILLKNKNIFIEFNYDLTFLVLFDESETDFVDMIESIFHENGFYKIA